MRKQFVTLMALLVTVNVIAQQSPAFQTRLTLGGNMNLDRGFYQTTVNIHGLEAVAMGTIQNAGIVSNNIANVFGNIGGIFGGNAPEIIKSGTTTYYKYDDMVIEESFVELTRKMAVVGIETGFYSDVFSAAIGVRNSKFRYLAPDFFIDVKTRPYAVYSVLREHLRGMESYDEFHDKLLSAISVGCMVGNDMGTPGFLNFNQKGYSGITLGMGTSIDRVSLQFEWFKQFKNSDIEHSFLRATVGYAISNKSL